MQDVKMFDVVSRRIDSEIQIKILCDRSMRVIVGLRTFPTNQGTDLSSQNVHIAVIKLHIQHGSKSQSTASDKEHLACSSPSLNIKCSIAIQILGSSNDTSTASRDITIDISIESRMGNTISCADTDEKRMVSMDIPYSSFDRKQHRLAGSIRRSSMVRWKIS
ncbi:hypothetical protein MRB53_039501 [Persea americana]|nr:hypothetical protein MRB53_039501 [Persea americana]